MGEVTDLRSQSFLVSGAKTEQSFPDLCWVFRDVPLPSVILYLTLGPKGIFSRFSCSVEGSIDFISQTWHERNKMNSDQGLPFTGLMEKLTPSVSSECAHPGSSKAHLGAVGEASCGMAQVCIQGGRCLVFSPHSQRPCRSAAILLLLLSYGLCKDGAPWSCSLSLLRLCLHTGPLRVGAGVRVWKPTPSKSGRVSQLPFPSPHLNLLLPRLPCSLLPPTSLQ